MVVIVKKGTTRKNMEQLLGRLQKQKRSKGVNAYKYCGIITLSGDPLEIQKKMRHEWE